MYMPGRSRTASIPSRTRMLAPVYEAGDGRLSPLAIAVGRVQVAPDRAAGGLDAVLDLAQFPIEGSPQIHSRSSRRLRPEGRTRLA